MNKNIKWLALAPVLLTSLSSLTSCSASNDTLYLRVINSEDYIYLQESPEDLPDLVVQFEEYAEKVFLPNYPEYKKISVIYDTSDTNETLYSELQTGKTSYDLMNVSDYMAQKIVAGNMAVPLYRTNGGKLEDAADYDMIPNYQDYGSANIKDRLDSIKAKEGVYLKDYAVGYMWGTLGILFNPEYMGFDREEAIRDMQSFGALWDSKYQGSISIKNSMRDTYALGVMYTYSEEFQDIKDKLEAGTINVDEYREQFASIFNRCEPKQVDEVAKSLEALKKNIFGLEVDSGKQDIITKKIGVNLAWSGDAVYSMDQAEDPAEVANPFELYYSVPELGSNLWFDAWIMPKCARSDAQYELAHLFLDFISDPENAVQNMEYTGYTSFIGGDSVIDLVRSWYDVRYEEVMVDEEYQVYSLNTGTDVVTPIDYSDFLADRDVARNDELLYYYMPTGEEAEDYEVTKADLLNEDTGAIVPLLDENGDPVMDGDNPVQKKYKDLTIVNDVDSDYDEVDLSYFFNGTYDSYTSADAMFYAEDYFASYQTEGMTEPEKSVAVGRQFFCQYPSEETLTRCAVMSDYGENNKYVMKMWENFKSNPLPTWAIITFITLLVIGVGFVALLIVNSVLKKKIKKQRIKN